MNDKRWIKDGMEVAHKDNIIQKMTVEKMVVITRKGGMSIVAGFKCHWWESVPGKQPKYNYGTFHSRELIPWEVAMKGPTGVQKFLEEKEQERNDD